MTSPSLVWFRQDLRLADNPALHAAAARGPVIPVYILDTVRTRPPGGASRWWLHQSLRSLENSLGGLVFRRGDPVHLLPELCRAANAGAVFWNRCYEPDAVARDNDVKAVLTKAGIHAESFNGALLNEPWEVLTRTGGPYKVYTPYWRAAAERPPADPIPAPGFWLADPLPAGDRLDGWALSPTKPDWAADWTGFWPPGEAGAQARLKDFIESGLDGYAELRDRPDGETTSRLSPHLHFGEISPRQIRAAVRARPDADGAEKFLAEVGWREFAYHLLYHFPALPDENWKPAFDAYPWAEDEGALRAWREGRTGYPLVDAGMRELWRTGYMHNRVRMIAASFLTKHLRIHWKRGEEWFWDTLVDADAANNAAGWQWVAGSGADAAPYFRIFNPVIQGRKFDPDGGYVRRWCPELARLETKFIHAPFEAAPAELAAAGITLGETYPGPIVDHGAARAAALAGYDAVKAAAGAAS